jgi:hypothetical protein
MDVYRLICQVYTTQIELLLLSINLQNRQNKTNGLQIFLVHLELGNVSL